MTLGRHAGLVVMSMMVCAHLAVAQNGDSGDPKGDSLYMQAREFLNRNALSAATKAFEDVWHDHGSSAYANEARYWQAVALTRMSNGPQELRQALDLLNVQRKKYPKSPVAGDAADLATRVRGQLAARGDAQAAYEIAQEAAAAQACNESVEVRVAALSALQNMKGADILEPLRKLFSQRDSCSRPVRARALAILAVRPVDETEDILIMAAQDPDDDIRRRAIPLLAQGTSDDAVKTMAKLLGEESNRDMQFALLNGLAYNTNSRARKLLRDFVARPAVDDQLKERAISSLVGSACGNGPRPVQQGRDRKSPDEIADEQRKMVKENAQYLRDLYPTIKNPAVRQRVVEGVVQIGGATDLDWLLQVASNPDETIDIRRTALYATGAVGNHDNGNRRFAGCRTQWMVSKDDDKQTVSTKALVKLYETIDNRQIREQLLLAYSRVAEDDGRALDKLIDVAKHDSDAYLRQRAVFWLSRLKNKRAVEALGEIVAQ